MNTARKSSDMPKSLMKTSISSVSSHMATSGAKYRARGTATPRNLPVGSDRSSLLSFR